MSWVTFKQPHPLDGVWSQALDAVQNAQTAMDDLGADFTDEELAEAGDAVTAVLNVIWALPARNLSDSLIKLSLAGVEDSPRTDCDIGAILIEAIGLLDASVARGEKLRGIMPDFLEGVIL